MNTAYEGKSELFTAHRNLTLEQCENIKHWHDKGFAINQIACILSLTKSYVHSYVIKLQTDI